MKRLLLFIIAISVTLSLAGCGGKSTTVETTAEPGANETVATQEPIETKTQEPTPTPEPTPEMNIEWTTATVTRTDNDGYKYEITYRFSPWILLSNTDVVEKAWKEVNRNNDTLPSFNDWGLSHNGNVYKRDIDYGKYFYATAMTDMYYCVGSFEIKNITEGWSITENSSRSFDFSFANNYNYYKPIENRHILRIFYSNGAKDTTTWFSGSAKLTSNKWGSVPFILMTAESFDPNNPNGKFLADIQKVAIGDKYLGVIGKDGVYIPPLSE